MHRSLEPWKWRELSAYPSQAGHPFILLVASVDCVLRSPGMMERWGDGEIRAAPCGVAPIDLFPRVACHACFIHLLRACSCHQNLADATMIWMPIRHILRKPHLIKTRPAQLGILESSYWCASTPHLIEVQRIQLCMLELSQWCACVQLIPS